MCGATVTFRSWLRTKKLFFEAFEGSVASVIHIPKFTFFYMAKIRME
jgi:hypothetical protein